MEKILEGKTAIVTGSGQGVGREIALCFAEYGANVITNNRKKGSSINAFEKTDISFNEEEMKALRAMNGDAETTAAEIIEKGGKACPFYGDVSDPEMAKAMVEAAVKTYGSVDIIVNNASSNWKGNIMDMTVDLWQTNINSKLCGTFYLMHYAIPYMKEKGFGRILNSASDAFTGISQYAAYGAANAGVVALSRASSKDLKGTGITVNSYTPLAKTRSWYNAEATYRLSGIDKSMIEKFSPKAMQMTAEGMVPFLAYLASEEAAGINGELFKLAADGEIGLWSESDVIKSIYKDDGKWTLDSLREQLPQLLGK